MADIDLPVWTIRPNWREGIRERLAWITDVLGNNFGVEQRRGLRLSPRRSFEIGFNPIGQSRSYFDLLLHRFGSTEFMLPLFHDNGRLTAAISAGATTVPVDTIYREFMAGDLAILTAADPFTFDVVEIEAVAADGLTVTAGGVTRTWGKHTSVIPLRRARLAEESQFVSLSDRVGGATLLFELEGANDLPDEGAWELTYNGHPVLTRPPNRRETINLDFRRVRETLDNELGLRTVEDPAGRSFTIQAHSTMLVGREERWAFRQMLYRLAGQRGTIWVPTFNQDVELARDRVAASALLDIKKIGYDYTGGVTSGREHVYLKGGAIIRQISSVGAALDDSEERLVLSAPLGMALSAGTTGSFIDTCRLSTDDVEILHHGDTDGAAEVTLGYRSFRDERTAPEPIDHPIPFAVMSVGNCGVWSDRAIHFALDVSGSMAGGRLATMKAAMSAALDVILVHVESAEIDVGVTAWSSGISGSIERRSVSAADLGDIDDWIQALGTGGGTNFLAGMQGADNFFAATSPALLDRFLFFITDGEGSNGAAAASLRDAMVPVPFVYGINIDLTNITLTLALDNTPADSVPVVSGADFSGLLNAISEALG